MNTPKVKLLDDRILVRPDEKSDRTSHGLYIPESSQKEMHQGVVVAMGSGLKSPKYDAISMAVNNIRVLTKDNEESQRSIITNHLDTIIYLSKESGMEISTGDKVVYGKFAGTDLEIEGVNYVIMRQTDVKLVITD